MIGTGQTDNKTNFDEWDEVCHRVKYYRKHK